MDHWAEENVDIYMLDNSLTYSTANSGYTRSFAVQTKKVRNGKFLCYIYWKFYKQNTDMWRYSTNLMDGQHTTVVTPRNKLFEACMKKLGWPWEIVDFWYY